MSRSYTISGNTKIRVELAGGDLSVVGWEGSELLVKGDEEDVRVESTSEAVTVSSSEDLSLRVPRSAYIEFVKVGGDVSLRGLAGGCELKEVSGDLSVRDIGSISIDTIQGDISLSNARGNVFIKNIHGDASLREVDGDVTIEMLADDLSLRGVRGNLRVMNLSGDASIHSVDGSIILDSVADDLALRGARGDVRVNVGEDVVVYLDPKPEAEYSINAGEDILVVLPKNANATLDIRGDEIFMEWNGFQNDDSTERVVVFGDGAAKISLNAGGEVRVSNRADAGESADEWGNFAGLNFDWSDFGERISRKVEQATARATKRADEAVRRAERHAARHAGHAKRGLVIGRWTWDFKGAPKPPTPPEPPSEPVSEEERMAILKMLAEKKITAQQAEELLNALDGGK